MANEAAEEIESIRSTTSPGRPQLPDYYDFLGVNRQAAGPDITNAYVAKLAEANGEEIEWAERAMAILTDPRKRAAYDARLKESLARGDCWISSLNLDANAREMRVRLDVPVKIEAGRAARVELSNLNTTEGISSNP